MQLTRRDVIAALAATGITVGGGAIYLSSDESGPTDDDAPGYRLDDHTLRTMTAAAAVLYPSRVENVATFVTRYLRGKVEDRPDHGRGIEDAAAYLDEYTTAWYDTGFADLDQSGRSDALDGMNADTAAPDPDGSDVQRVRYYVVNELLYALYTTPTGGELVGLENPRGHPGGLDSYRRGPQS